MNYKKQTINNKTMWRDMDGDEDWMTVEELAEKFKQHIRKVRINLGRNFPLDFSTHKYLCEGGPLDGEILSHAQIRERTAFGSVFVKKRCKGGVFRYGVPNRKYLGKRFDLTGLVKFDNRELCTEPKLVSAYQSGFKEGFEKSYTVEEAGSAPLARWLPNQEHRRLYRKGLYIGVHARMEFGPEDHKAKLSYLHDEARRTQREVERYFKMIGRVPPKAEPCQTCEWIAVCKKTERTCPKFRNYAGGPSGASMVPDIRFDRAWPNEEQNV